MYFFLSHGLVVHVLQERNARSVMSVRIVLEKNISTIIRTMQLVFVCAQQLIVLCLRMKTVTSVRQATCTFTVLCGAHAQSVFLEMGA